MRKLLLVPVLVALATALAFASVSAAAPRVSSVVRVSAVKSGLKYSTSTLHAKRGRIELVFTNLSPLKHDVRIESGENELGGTKPISKGSATAYVTLKPGKYHFYCSVPGHEAAGMQGYLIVS